MGNHLHEASGGKFHPGPRPPIPDGIPSLLWCNYYCEAKVMTVVFPRCVSASTASMRFGVCIFLFGCVSSFFSVRERTMQELEFKYRGQHEYGKNTKKGQYYVVKHGGFGRSGMGIDIGRLGQGIFSRLFPATTIRKYAPRHTLLWSAERRLFAEGDSPASRRAAGGWPRGPKSPQIILFTRILQI